jgi:hypothetical protein
MRGAGMIAVLLALGMMQGDQCPIRARVDSIFSILRDEGWPKEKVKIEPWLNYPAAPR